GGVGGGGGGGGGAGRAAVGARRFRRRRGVLDRRHGGAPRYRQHLRRARRRPHRTRGAARDRTRSPRFARDAPSHCSRREPAAGAGARTHVPGIPTEVIMAPLPHLPTRREMLLGSGALFAWAYAPN